MSAPRFHKVIKQLEEGLYNLGYAKAKAKWLGNDAASNAAGYMNFTDTTSSTGDIQFIVRMKAWEVAGHAWPDSMKTQSHASGEFIEGPALVEIFMEAALADASAGMFSGTAATAAAAIARMKFQEDILHILRGQNGAMVRLYLTAPGSVPSVNGVNGAGSDSLGSSIGVLLPYGRVAAPGTLPG